MCVRTVPASVAVPVSSNSTGVESALLAVLPTVAASAMIDESAAALDVRICSSESSAASVGAKCMLSEKSRTTTPSARVTLSRVAAPTRSLCWTCISSDSSAGTPHSRYSPRRFVETVPTRRSVSILCALRLIVISVHAARTLAPEIGTSVSASTTRPATTPFSGPSSSPGHTMSRRTAPEGSKRSERVVRPSAITSRSVGSATSSESRVG